MPTGQNIVDEGTIRSLLGRIPWLGLIGTSGETHLSCKCLMMHKHTKGYDSHPSMTISYGVPVPWVQCFSCGYKFPLEATLYELVTVGRLSPDIAVDFTEAKLSKITIGYQPTLSGEEDYSIPLSHLAKNEYSQEVLDFFKLKNISAVVAKKMGLVYVPEGHSDEWMAEDPRTGEQKIVTRAGIGVPLVAKSDKGFRCVGVQMRYLSGKFRYSALYKFQQTRRLFSERLLSLADGKDVFLVEGPFDQLHILTERFISFAMLGTNFTEHKAILLREAEPKKVHILLDNDSAGYKGTSKASAILGEYGVPFLAHKAYKDPKQYSHQDLTKLINKSI